MKQTMTNLMFITEFRKIRPDQFSYYALEALFDYYEELEAAIDEELEFDPIAICCEWIEYDTVEEAAQDYGLNIHKSNDDLIKELREKYYIIVLNDNRGILISE
jgi:hypothetical protein